MKERMAPGPPVADIRNHVGVSIRSQRTNNPASVKSQVQQPRGRHAGWLGGL